MKNLCLPLSAVFCFTVTCAEQPESPVSTHFIEQLLVTKLLENAKRFGFDNPRENIVSAEYVFDLAQEDASISATVSPDSVTLTFNNKGGKRSIFGARYEEYIEKRKNTASYNILKQLQSKKEEDAAAGDIKTKTPLYKVSEYTFCTKPIFPDDKDEDSFMCTTKLPRELFEQMARN